MPSSVQPQQTARLAMLALALCAVSLPGVLWFRAHPLAAAAIWQWVQQAESQSGAAAWLVASNRPIS